MTDTETRPLKSPAGPHLRGFSSNGRPYNAGVGTGLTRLKTSRAAYRSRHRMISRRVFTCHGALVLLRSHPLNRSPEPLREGEAPACGPERAHMAHRAVPDPSR
jgi:hypothetical protein